MMNLDRFLGLLLLPLAIGYGWIAFHFPVAFAGPESVGPATFPKILSAVISACSIYLIMKPDQLQEEFDWKALPELFLVLVVLLLYVFLMEPMGFIPATTLMVAVLCWRMGVRPWPALVTGLASSAAVFALFHFGLELPLPTGSWEV